MCRRRVVKIDAGIADVSGGQTVSLHISGACPPSACAQRPDGRKVNRRSQTCLPKVRMCGRRLVCRDDGALLGEKNECHGAQDEPETHCCFHARRTNCGMNESDWVWQDVSSCYTLHTAADTNTNTDILMDFLVTVESVFFFCFLLDHAGPVGLSSCVNTHLANKSDSDHHCMLFYKHVQVSRAPNSRKKKRNHFSDNSKHILTQYNLIHRIHHKADTV